MKCGWNVKSGGKVERGEAGEMYRGFECCGEELRFLSGKSEEAIKGEWHVQIGVLDKSLRERI